MYVTFVNTTDSSILMKKYIDDFSVVQNRRLNHEYVILTLKLDRELPEILPGQFAEVKVESGPNTFLRRPISIHDVDETTREIKLLIQEIGEGTRLMGALHLVTLFQNLRLRRYCL